MQKHMMSRKRPSINLVKSWHINAKVILLLYKPKTPLSNFKLCDTS